MRCVCTDLSYRRRKSVRHLESAQPPSLRVLTLTLMRSPGMTHWGFSTAAWAEDGGG